MQVRVARLEDRARKIQPIATADFPAAAVLALKSRRVAWPGALQHLCIMTHSTIHMVVDRPIKELSSSNCRVYLLRHERKPTRRRRDAQAVLEQLEDIEMQSRMLHERIGRVVKVVSLVDKKVYDFAIAAAKKSAK